MLALISSLLTYPATRQEIMGTAFLLDESEPVVRLLTDVDSMLATVGEFLDRTNQSHQVKSVQLAIQVKGACLDLRIAAERYRDVGHRGERLAILFQELADWLEVLFDPGDDWNRD